MGAHHVGGRPEDEARAGRLRVIEAVHTHAVDRKQGTAVRRVENGEGEGAGQVIEKPLPVLAIGEPQGRGSARSEEHTSELQSLMRRSYAVFRLKKKKKKTT